MGVGIRLKSILRDKKMTIKQLSEKSGIPLNTLYSITKRDSLRVDRVILERISKALNVDTYDLYPEEMRGAAILADTVKGAGLSFKGSNGNKNRSEQGRLVFDTSKIVDALNVTLEREKRKDRYIKAFDLLNDVGQEIAVGRVEELTEIQKYQLHHDPDEK